MVGNFVIFGCMYLAKISPEISNVAGYAVGLIFSYVLNKNYTFGSVQSKRGEILRFLTVFAFAYALSFISLLIFIHKLNIHESVSQILAGIVYTVMFYILNKFYVFRDANAN